MLSAFSICCSISARSCHQASADHSARGSFPLPWHPRERNQNGPLLRCEWHGSPCALTANHRRTGARRQVSDSTQASWAASQTATKCYVVTAGVSRITASRLAHPVTGKLKRWQPGFPAQMISCHLVHRNSSLISDPEVSRPRPGQEGCIPTRMIACSIAPPQPVACSRPLRICTSDQTSPMTSSIR